MTLIWLILVAALGLALVFSTLFHALRDFSVRKVEELAGRDGADGLIQPVLEDPEEYARAVGFMRLAANVVVIVSVVVLVGPLVDPPSEGRPALHDIHWMNTLGAFLVAVALVFLFSQVVPISISKHAGERLMVRWAWLIRAVHAITLPLKALGVLDLAIKRLAGDADVTEEEELEEEVLAAVTEGERSGRFEAVERDMIEGVIDLAEKTAEEIMTPRTEIEGFELTDDLAYIKRFIIEAGHSRIPVYEGDLDHIVGLLYAKDLIPFVGLGPERFELRPILREAMFVPESKSVKELLTELRQKKVHLAIVIDEYGGTAGLVTFEDILEQVVGEIQDEYEPAEEGDPAIFVDPTQHCAQVEAWVSMADANEHLAAIGIHLAEHDDYDTVGGYVLAVLGHIPVTGEQFTRDGAAMTVLEAEPTRVLRLRIESVPRESIAEPADPIEATERAGDGPSGDA